MGQVERCLECWAWVGVEERVAHRRTHVDEWNQLQEATRHRSSPVRTFTKSHFLGKVTIGDYSGPTPYIEPDDLIVLGVA